jgi:hypothetical protein
VLVETAAVGDQKTSWLARLGWQGVVAIIAVLAYLGIAFSLYLRLKHLPGPYYGGDLYAHHGFALNYIANGFWTDPYFIGHYAFYPWLGNYVFIALSLLPGVSLMQAEMFTGMVTIPLAAIAYYFLGWQLFKNKTWALAMMLLALARQPIPAGAPNNLPWMITIPLWFAFWLRAEETRQLRDKVLSGLFMGFTALSHVAFFLAGMALFAFTAVVETLRQPNKREALVAAAKLYGPMVLAGFLVSLLFYGPIIVNYHAKTLNPLFEYNGPAIELLGIGWAAGTIFRSLFNFSSWAFGALSILVVLGLAACVLNWNKKTPRYAVLWFIAGTLAPMHHLITKPLLGRWILPGHLWAISLSLMIFAVVGLQLAQRVVAQKWPRMNAQRMVFVALLLIAFGLFWMRYEEHKNDRWVQFGERLDGQTQAWLTLGGWAENSTSPNAVFLAHDEVCFAVNGVSGRKCVFVRRTHANYFVDVEQRYADGMVMLYGNNSALTKKLLNDYQVDYVLIDALMMQQPVLVDAKFEQYLAQNQVSFAKVRERKDPSDAQARVFDLLAVPIQPLNKELEPMLEEAASFNVNNAPFLRAFKVRR